MKEIVELQKRVQALDAENAELKAQLKEVKATKLYQSHASTKLKLQKTSSYNKLL